MVILGLQCLVRMNSVNFAYMFRNACMHVHEDTGKMCQCSRRLTLKPMLHCQGKGLSVSGVLL